MATTTSDSIIDKQKTDTVSGIQQGDVGPPDQIRLAGLVIIPFGMMSPPPTRGPDGRSHEGTVHRRSSACFNVTSPTDSRFYQRPIGHPGGTILVFVLVLLFAGREGRDTRDRVMEEG